MHVNKKDGSVIICLDAREIIKRIENDHEMPKNVEELLQDLFGVKNISSLDLSSSFWQISLTVKNTQHLHLKERYTNSM